MRIISVEKIIRNKLAILVDKHAMYRGVLSFLTFKQTKGVMNPRKRVNKLIKNKFSNIKVPKNYYITFLP